MTAKGDFSISVRWNRRTMVSKKARPQSVTEYINAAPKEAQEKLHENASMHS